MKHILNKIFIPCFFIFSAFNIQAETTLKFDGVLTNIESGTTTIAIDDEFKGAVTFNEATILTDRENSISSFTFISNTFSVSSIDGEIQSSFDGYPFPVPANIDPIRDQFFQNPHDFLSEIWIDGTKIDQGNLASLNPVITSLFSPGSVDFRLVFKNSSINVTLMGKINQVITASTPPSEDAPICEAGTDPQVIKKGEGTALWWWSQDATSAIINNGIGAVTLPSDYKWIHPSETTTYIMVAKNENGVPTTCKTTVVVEGQVSPICEMGADPQIINAGEGTALWWWSNAASSANIDHNIGAVSIPNDYIWFHPTETTTYTMNAIGDNGETTTCNTTITVQ